MKYVFDNAGVAQKQSALLNLSAGELSAEVQAIRQDFVAWMNASFALTESQEAQLESLPSGFRDTLAHAIADAWAQRSLIAFDKQVAQQQKKPTVKDVILEKSATTQHLIGAQQMSEVNQLAIWIKYHV
ncbi:hypothetical protein [Sphingobacterium sp. SYP-B4668]|uniref:hypothetical protein n=1 Tax=Sphingobacterium sp. SYP-B4668 TaxID=2996035 RepID=UPI0022DD92FC|nr:hypothetical protein [Sphingobacterium sp. SYP-B4668]